MSVYRAFYLRFLAPVRGRFVRAVDGDTAHFTIPIRGEITVRMLWVNTEESHGAEGLLEYPQYTRPVDFRGHVVPEVLAGGHHAEIAKWRAAQSLARTKERRPDLLVKK